MVFNKFTHLARPSLSKTFVHGYAQSVVAATQSTPFSPLNKHPSHKAGRPSTAQQYAPFSAVGSTSASANRPSQLPAESSQHQDAGLKAYHDAWQKLQHSGEGKEWRQYQFPKLIEPNPVSKVQDGKDAHQGGDVLVKDGVADRGALERSYSTSAVEDIKRAQDEAEEVAVAKVDQAIATVIQQIQETSVEGDGAKNATDLSTSQVQIASSTNPSELPESPSSGSLATRDKVSSRSSPLSDATAATSVQSEVDAQTHLQHIKQLQDVGAFKEIPPAFASMLASGIRPSPEAYNALLASAVSLSNGKQQVIPKALDIYSDMLRRKVTPQATFYSSIIGLLSQRALYVAQMKDDLELQKGRYAATTETSSFLFASNAAEYATLAEDDALNQAVQLFNSATQSIGPNTLSAETYYLLILACARHQNVDNMVKIYHHLESHGIQPAAAIFPAMIGAFAGGKDLSSSLECYNEYRSLAIEDDAGQFSILGRSDAAVYAALIKSYTTCGKSEGGQHFYDKIIDSFATDTPERLQQLEAIQDAVNVDVYIQDSIDAGDFGHALSLAKGQALTFPAREQAFLKICAAAADSSDMITATKAYQCISGDSAVKHPASLALFAMHLRTQDIETAQEHWDRMTSSAAVDHSFFAPTTLFALALIRQGQIDKALDIARETFAEIRHSSSAPSSSSDLADQIDEAIEVLAKAVSQVSGSVSATASSNILRAMIENGGLISSVTEHVLTSLGPEQVASLSWENLILTLQVQSGMLDKSNLSNDQAHASRFAHLLDLATSSNVPLDARTVELVGKALNSLPPSHAGLAHKWTAYQNSLIEASRAPQPSPSLSSATVVSDTYDPYGPSTDFRGSTLMVEELDNHRNSHGLNEALTKFRNVRRAGRHPRYIAYAKLISAAAREGRLNLTHDILGMARHDVPFLAEYPVVRHGWSSILDSMVGACLTAGKRNLAEQFHQEMLEKGSAPTANTYGLYITTLKESTKTFDEATEAVKIFHRAISEGVQPSSFLYNALIGKLGKARRIDDCLRYFQEMRGAGIRPTSVTYGTVVNALCRVSDERFAEELFDEMESMPNYKPRPAPYNSLMQYFLMTKRDSQKVLAYYERMKSMRIQPTMHTFKLLIDTYATLEPVNLTAAEGVLDTIRAQGLRPEAVHFASLIHAKGCALHDMAGARQIFDEVLAKGEVKPQACLYQALFESMVANHCVAETEEVLDSMSANRVEMTPYIANTLIHGWAMENQISKSKAIYDSVGMDKREPSTYEAMTRAFLTAEDRKGALTSVHEMLSRGYPSAVSSKILELVGHGNSRTGNVVLSELIA